jgi:putative membrane protein
MYSNFRRTEPAQPRVWLLAAALAAAFASPSVLAQTTGGTAPGAMSSPNAGARAASQLQRADQGMLTDIAQANMAEIETARIALDKSKDERVRKFAQTMVDDHGTALKEVQQLAQTKGVSLPDGPGVKHKTKATAIKALSGETFDNQYLSHAGIGDHRATLELLQKTQREAKDADLKALATKMIPVVQAHLSEAEQIAPHKKN